MKCPRCVQRIHRSAPQCPHCGFATSDLDDLYGADAVSMLKLSDVAGVLRMKERRNVERWLHNFEDNFPQLFFSVYFGSLDDCSHIRQYGMWLLNRSNFKDVDLTRSNDGGILLVVDVNGKSAFIANGYLLDIYLKEEDTFNALSKAHPHLLQGNYYKALKIVITKVSAALVKSSKQVKRNPKKYHGRAGKDEQGDLTSPQTMEQPHSQVE